MNLSAFILKTTLAAVCIAVLVLSLDIDSTTTTTQNASTVTLQLDNAPNMLTDDQLVTAMVRLDQAYYGSPPAEVEISAPGIKFVRSKFAFQRGRYDTFVQRVAGNIRDVYWATCAAVRRCGQLSPAKLEWWEFLCDDFSELEDASWPSSSGELRLSVSHGNDSAVLMAMDALLSRVGSQLTSFTLSALSALSGPMADVIVARCPRLRHLDVMNANAHFHKKLVEAFDADRCWVASLTVQSAWGSQENGCGLLLASLKDPTRGTSRRLHTFTLGEAWT